MSDAERRLAAERANRDSARQIFLSRLERIKADIDSRGIGARLAGSVVGEVSDAVDVGLDVARERKGLIAGTIGALLLWIFRQPLIAAAASLFERFAGERNQEIEDEIRDENQ